MEKSLGNCALIRDVVLVNFKLCSIIPHNSCLAIIPSHYQSPGIPVNNEGGPG